MKKFFAAVVFAAVFCGAVSAQDFVFRSPDTYRYPDVYGYPDMFRYYPDGYRYPETYRYSEGYRYPDGYRYGNITILNGSLRYVNGMFAVESATRLYYIPELQYFAGNFDGLRENARITLRGYIWGRYVIPVTINLSGRSYDMFPRYYNRVRTYYRDCPYAYYYPYP